MIKAMITMKTGELRIKDFRSYLELGVWMSEHCDAIAQLVAGEVRACAIRQGRDK